MILLSITDLQCPSLMGIGQRRSIKVQKYKPESVCIRPSIILDTSSLLENVSEKRLTSCQNRSENCEFCSSSKEGMKPSSPRLETALKVSLFLFLILLMVYHISNLIKTEIFELETCDIDNQSNTLFTIC